GGVSEAERGITIDGYETGEGISEGEC
ncbi:hypothetical protein A2U01_0095845, partial [Trifolium medium]|nr:hypothetical protein [Trifolium medium]